MRQLYLLIVLIMTCHATYSEATGNSIEALKQELLQVEQDYYSKLTHYQQTSQQRLVFNNQLASFDRNLSKLQKKQVLQRKELDEIRNLELDDPDLYSSATQLFSYRQTVKEIKKLKLDRKSLIKKESGINKSHDLAKASLDESNAKRDSIELNIVMLEVKKLAKSIEQERIVEVHKVITCDDRISVCEEKAIEKAIEDAIEMGSSFITSSMVETNQYQINGESLSDEQSYKTSSSFKSVLKKYEIIDSACDNKKCTGYGVKIKALVYGKSNTQELCRFLSSGKFCRIDEGIPQTQQLRQDMAGARSEKVLVTLKVQPQAAIIKVKVNDDFILVTNNTISLLPGLNTIELYANKSYAIKKVEINKSETIKFKMGPVGPYKKISNVLLSPCPLGLIVKDDYCDGRVKSIDWLSAKESAINKHWNKGWHLPSKEEIEELLYADELEMYFEEMSGLVPSGKIWTSTKYGYKTGRAWVYDLNKMKFLPYDRENKVSVIYIK